MGFESSYAVSGHPYTRKLDSQVLNVLAGIAQSMHKMTNDIRLLQHLKELEEPFEKKQIGSSAMAYKRNPMRSERISSLSKFIIAESISPAMVEATQWLERSLDDSANKRLSIPQAFMAADAILEIGINVTDGLVVYESMINKHIIEELPFMATENILMEAVKRGGDRQELHEEIRELSMKAAYRVKHEGLNNNLIDLILESDKFNMLKREEISDILDPMKFVGRAPEQVVEFVEEYLGLTYNPLTTQIESHDYTCHILDGIRHFNNVLVDFDVDMWLYISMEYFKQIPVKGEVGSSTMPHKVNPIRFENSEANVDMSNNICVGLSNKLPRSRMQRDLSDSSSQRNIGLAFGYSLQAISETTNGLAKCVVNKDKLAADLNEKWEVLAEPIQTMLRKYGISDAYDQLKELTRGKNISQEAIMEFAKGLDVLSDEDRQTLLDMTPASYIGYASNLCDIDL